MTRSAAIRLTWSAAGVEHGQERGAPFTHRCGRGGRFLGLGRWERCDEPLSTARLHRLGLRRPHYRQHGTPRSGLTDSERRRLGERSEHLPSGFLWPPLDCDANAGGLPHNGGSPGGTTQSSHRFSQTLRYEPSARRWPRDTSIVSGHRSTMKPGDPVKIHSSRLAWKPASVRPITATGSWARSRRSTATAQQTRTSPLSRTRRAMACPPGVSPRVKLVAPANRATRPYAAIIVAATVLTHQRVAEAGSGRGRSLTTPPAATPDAHSETVAQVSTHTGCCQPDHTDRGRTGRPAPAGRLSPAASVVVTTQGRCDSLASWSCDPRRLEPHPEGLRSAFRHQCRTMVAAGLVRDAAARPHCLSRPCS